MSADPVNVFADTGGACRATSVGCPRGECRYHLVGDLKDIARGKRSAHVACSLDVADLGGVSLVVVGDVLGLTRERVRQIELNALKHLRARMKTRGLPVTRDAI